MHWNVLIDEEALTALLPAEYAHFARPVKEGLVVFLSGLPAEIQRTILAEQAALPTSTTLSERLGLLARCCPTLHKLGQLLARDSHLAAELRAELRPLESLPPSIGVETIQATLTQELGPLEDRGVIVLGPAIAEASVAVVIPFREVGVGSPREGVFKVLKPGIEERLRLELELMSRVGSHLDEKCVDLSIPHLDYQNTFEQVRDKLQGEVRLDQEQKHLKEAASLFADDVDVQIPVLFDHCTPRVTAMERVFGLKITDHWLDCGADKRRLAEIVTRALISQPVFSPHNRAMFHCDPHAGNLIYTYDGRLAILDWSLVGHLGDGERVAMAQIVLAAIMCDARRIVAVLEKLSTRRHVNRSTLCSVVGNWLRRIRNGQFPGINWLLGMFDDATQTAQLRLGPDLMMLRKALLTLEGVINDLGAQGFQSEESLFRQFLIQFAIEWPQRWISLPTSRAFATRLSNIDLTATVVGMPLGAARYWQAKWLDILGNNSLATK